MRRSRSLGSVEFDPEIERTLRRLRKEHREAVMAGDNENAEIQRALRDYATPTLAGITSSIRTPPI